MGGKRWTNAGLAAAPKHRNGKRALKITGGAALRDAATPFADCPQGQPVRH
jgi:hypothetical protein